MTKSKEIFVDEEYAQLVVVQMDAMVQALAERLQSRFPKKNALEWDAFLYRAIEINARTKADLADAFAKGDDQFAHLSSGHGENGQNH